MFGKKITCIRHSIPYSNTQADPCLSPEGIIQANAIQADQFDMIILSPLRRAIDTYVHSPVSGSEIIVSSLLREQRDGTVYNQLIGKN